MSGIASVLACSVAAFSMVSFAAQALPGSPAPARVAASDVTLVGGFCGPGLHRDSAHGCVPYGLPYIEGPRVGLPYVAAPTVGLPYVAAPRVGLPYIEGPRVGLPYVAAPIVGLPYVAAPRVGLPYEAGPTWGLPYW